MLTALLYVRSSQMWPQRPTCVIATRVATRRDGVPSAGDHLISRVAVDVNGSIPVRNDARAIGCWVAGLPTDARSEEAGGGWRYACRARHRRPPACPPRAMRALGSRLEGGPRATHTGLVSSADCRRRRVNLAGLYSTFRHCQCQFHLARHHESVLRVQAGC